MHESEINTITRRATAMSPRVSLRLLGGASLAGFFAAPAIPVASKTRKNARRRCRTYEAQCRTGVEDYCTGNPGCQETNLPCCEHFAQCRVDTGIVCLVTGEPKPTAARV